MHTLLLLTGLLAIVAFLAIDRTFLASRTLSKKQLILKLEQVIDKELRLYATLEKMISDRKAWSLNVYADSDITYGEYLELLKAKSGIGNIAATLNKFEKEKPVSLEALLAVIRNRKETTRELKKAIKSQKNTLENISVLTAAS